MILKGLCQIKTNVFTTRVLSAVQYGPSQGASEAMAVICIRCCNSQTQEHACKQAGVDRQT